MCFPGAFDVVRRADDAQDVAALHDRPRLARHQLGASLERLEVDAARARVLCQPLEGVAVHVGAGHDGRHRLHRHRQQRGVVDLRSDVPLRLEERAPARGDDEPIAALQRQRRLQFQQLAVPLHPLDRQPFTGVAIFERRKARPGQRGVLDAVRPQAEVSGGKALAAALAAGELSVRAPSRRS